MRHLRSLDGVQLDASWLTIGSFDGVHLGHQVVVKALVAEAHQAGDPAVVVTFHPHPALVLGKRTGPHYLTTPDERAHLLGALGVDYVITHPFDKQVAHLSAEQFMQNLKTHLNPKQFWVGHDFALGHNRSGDIHRLKELGDALGYRLHVVRPFLLDGEVVSSSRIRKFLSEGDVVSARKLLGRNYSISGEVISGDARGHTLGIPTANLKIPVERFLPQGGVYACYATIPEGKFQAVTNIGVRPTFDGKVVKVHVETHLLDFSGDLYTKTLTLEFVSRLRAEKRFETVDALVAQITADIQRTRGILEVKHS